MIVKELKKTIENFLFLFLSFLLIGCKNVASKSNSVKSEDYSSFEKNVSNSFENIHSSSLPQFDSSSNNCTSDCLKPSVTIEEIASWKPSQWYLLTGHDYSSNQSCAAYGGYAFLFAPDSPNASAVIVDLKDTSKVYSSSIPSSVHANSAQFIDVFFDSKDYFPLLIMSNCEANGKTNSVNVIRLIKDDETFVFSLIKKLFFGTAGMINYGSSIVFDTDRRKIVAVYNLNGDWRVIENNPIIIKEFDEPNWTNSDNFYYSDDSGIVVATFPFFVFQGVGYGDNKLFVGCSLPYENPYWEEYVSDEGSREVVLVIDNTTGTILDFVHSTKDREIEGVCFCDGCVFLSQRINTYTETDTITWLYKFVWLG